MFCEKCGTLIPEGQTECPNCNPAVENTAQEEPMVEPEVQVEPETFAEPTFEASVKPKKAKKGKKLLAGGIATAVVALGLAAAIFFNFLGVGTAVKGFWAKTFSSDEEYFAFVEKNALSSAADYVTDYYGMAFQNLSMDSIATDSTIELNISDEAIALIEDALPEEYKVLDLNNYKNIRLGLNGVFKDNKMALDASLGLGANNLLDLKTVLDMAGEDAYVGVTNLSDKYIAFKDALKGINDAALNSPMSQIDYEELSKALPSDKTLNKVLNKYLGVALDNMGNVTKDSDKFEIGDYSEKLVVLEKRVSEKDLLKACEALLKELKGDSDVKAIIKDFEDFMLDEYPDMLGSSYEKGTAYDEFKVAIEDALEELEDVDPSSEEIFTLVDYVNGSHEIVGRAITINDEEIISYMTVHEGDNFAFELVCEEAELEITGQGTDKKDVVDADYTVEVEGKEVVDISLEGFSFKESKLNGSVTVTPSSELLSLAVGDSSASSMLSMLEPAIKVSFESGENSGKVTFAVLSKNKEFVSISISSTVSSDTNVEIPTNTIDSEDIMDWVDTIDVDKAVAVIKNLKLPKEINDMVDTYAKNIKDAGGIGAFAEAMMNASNSYNDYSNVTDEYYDDYSGMLDEF